VKGPPKSKLTRHTRLLIHLLVPLL